MNRRLLAPLIIVLTLGGCASVSDSRPEVVRKGEYYLEHGVDAYGNSDYVTAADFFHKALAQYRSIDDTHGILLARINLAETSMATGSSQAVLTQLDAAESVARRVTPPLYLERLQLLRAQVYWRERNREKVIKLITPLLPEFDTDDEPVNNPDLLAITAVILRTDIAFDTLDSHPREARRWLIRLEICLRLNDESTPLHNARLNRFKALLASSEGDTPHALAMLDEALKEYRKAAVRPAIAATLTETARIFMGQGQWARAEERLKRALYIRVWIMDRVGSREVLYLLSAVYSELGDEEKARLSRQQAETITNRGSSAWKTLNRGLLLNQP